jgi:hypothetical protein
MKASSIRSALMVVSTFSLITAGSAAAQGGQPEGAAGTANPRAVSMYNLGLQAYKQGSPESAIIFFKRACDIDPNLADAQYNLAVIYQAEKRFKDALPRFEEVLRIKPSDPDAHYQMGAILTDLGRFSEARTHLSAIAPNNIHFAEAQRRLAQINQAQAAGMQGLPTQPQPTPQNPPSYYNPNLTQSPPAIQDQPQSQPQLQPQLTDPSTAQPQMQAQQQAAPPPQVTPSTPNPVPVLANSTLRVIATGFNAPSGMAFDKNGNLYVANYMTNSIDRIGTDGTRSTFSTGVTLRGPIGLVTDDSNNLYVANYSGGTVARISPAGVSTVVASGFRKPYYLTLDHDGNLYVSQQEDNSIVRITLPKPAPKETALK